MSSSRRSTRSSEHLERNLGQSNADLRVEDRQVGQILREMTKCQGGFVDGRRDEALRRISNDICQMVKDLADGKLSAEAQEGSSPSGRSNGRDEKGEGTPEAAPEAAPASGSGNEGRFAWLRGVCQDLRKAFSSEEALLEQPQLQVQTPKRRRRSTLIANFFTGGFKEEASGGGQAISPVMLHEAKVAKAERKKPKGNQRSGGPRPDAVGGAIDDPDKEVADYLKRERGVESTTSPTFGDDSQQAIELQRHQIDVAMQRREEAAHRSHVRNARHNMISTVSNDDNDGSGPLRESRYDRSASVQSALKRALRSVRSGRRPSVVVRSVKHERESQREVLGTAHL